MLGDLSNHPLWASRCYINISKGKLVGEPDYINMRWRFLSRVSVWLWAQAVEAASIRPVPPIKGSEPWTWAALTILLISSNIPTISHHPHPPSSAFSFSCCSAPAQHPVSSTHETLQVDSQNHLMGSVPLQYFGACGFYTKNCHNLRQKCPLQIVNVEAINWKQYLRCELKDNVNEFVWY